jgi:hypothetical protein
MVQQREPHGGEVSDADAGTATATLHHETGHCDVNATRTLQNSSLAPAEARTFVASDVRESGVRIPVSVSQPK